jgi:hypothetical protein
MTSRALTPSKSRNPMRRRAAGTGSPFSPRRGATGHLPLSPHRRPGVRHPGFDECRGALSTAGPPLFGPALPTVARRERPGIRSTPRTERRARHDRDTSRSTAPPRSAEASARVRTAVRRSTDAADRCGCRTQRRRVRGLRGGRRVVAASAPLRGVRSRGLLRLVAASSRVHARGDGRSPVRPEL